MSSNRLKILLDTNIVVDYLNKRDPYFESSRLLMILGYTNEVELWITSSQITDLIYILTEGGKPARLGEVLLQLRKLRQFVKVFATSEIEIDKMLLGDWKDPEDFLLYQCALGLQADAIVTRNGSDFEEQNIIICNCGELFDWLHKNKHLNYSLENLSLN